MSIPKISGRQARDLLDIWAGDVEGLTFAQLGADRSYGDLFGAAPALAETVAWLYDRIREIHNDQRCWADAYRAPIEWDPEGKDPARLARAEAHDDCADMLQTLLDDEEARP